MATPEPGLETWVLWAGTAGMILGACYFLWQGRDVEDDRQQEYYIITTFVPVVAAASYLAMATGVGITTVDVEGLGPTTVYWARYVDWLVTTPLLLLDLCLLAGADRNTTYTMVGIDVLMVATGLVGAFARAGQVVRIGWWAVSTGALLVLLYYLFGTLSDAAAERPARAGALFAQLRGLTVLLWLMYPVVWILGTESGIQAIPIVAETTAFAVLDLAAKVGFGVLLLRSREVLRAAPASIGGDRRGIAADD